MIRHVLLEGMDVEDASPLSVAALYCYRCESSLLLPKVGRESVEEAQKLGQEHGSDAFAAAMMTAYKQDTAQKFAITAFLLAHQSHGVSPALIVETTARGGAA